MHNRYLLALFLLFVTGILFAARPTWKSLKEDGLHDPENPAIDTLQEPAEALLQLPPDTTGNMVSWGQALREEYIEPRSTLFKKTKVEVLDNEIIMANTGEMPLVLFPHKPHSQWLDCNNCHDSIFKEEIDANPINMFAILSGEYCGRCHGAVSFPLTECLRCHSVPRNSFTGKPGVQPRSANSRRIAK